MEPANFVIFIKNIQSLNSKIKKKLFFEGSSMGARERGMGARKN